MVSRLRLAPSMLALLAITASGSSLAQGTPRCADLPQRVKRDHLAITQATEVAAGAFRPPVPSAGGPPVSYAALPGFCRVAGTLKPTLDSDIRFEVWMPLANWNGKYVGGGNGVWAGSVAYGDMVVPLAAGYATATSDVGHQGNPLDASFLVGHPEKLIDFGHRATHETALAAKAIIETFYARKPSRSLYASCSTGGRIGLMEAYRYPEDYDAISAMAPANPMVPLMVLSQWTGQAALKDAASAVPAAKFQLVKRAAMAACDATDGVKDGVIAHPPACRFDPGVLQCKGEEAADCLTAAQLTAVRAIEAGPKDSRTGAQIYPGFPVGSESQVTLLTSGPEPFPVATSFFRGPVFNDAQWDFRSFDYDRDVKRALVYGSDALDVPADRLDRFFAGGRKLLLSHGWADGLIPAGSTVAFYEALRKDIGTKQADAGVRLFMAPGMDHCAGGDGPSSIDVIGTIDRWVETGQAPERLVARSLPGAPQKSRPLCPHPQVAKYDGRGNPDDERSFSCATP